MNTITAVMFDVGGVLHKTVTAVDADLLEELKITPEILASMHANELLLLASGDIDEQTFWQRASAQYGIRSVHTSENLLGRAYERAIEPHMPMLQLVKELGSHTNVKLAILSNTIEPHARANRQAGIYDGFDYIFLSHELKMRKPDPRIYTYALTTLNTQPQSVLFIDDLAENIKAAEALGIHGIMFTEPTEVIAKIKQALAI